MRQELSTIAKEELNNALSHGGNAKEAVASLMARAKQDPELYHQLMDPLLKDACCNAIERECHTGTLCGVPLWRRGR
jgi:hypothetical protein